MSELNKIDDKYAREHEIDRILIPKFEPSNGNEGARLLFVLERPGPKSVGTTQAGGSGVISQYNNDPSAKTMRALLELSGLQSDDICLTNIVPHVRSERAKVSNERVTRDEIFMGVSRLIEVIDAMPNLETVILVGTKAQKIESFLQVELQTRRPEVSVTTMFHTSAQAAGGGRNPQSSKHHMWRHNFELMSSFSK